MKVNNKGEKPVVSMILVAGFSVFIQMEREEWMLADYASGLTYLNRICNTTISEQVPTRYAGPAQP